MNVLGILGSLKAHSANRALLNALVEVAPSDIVIDVYDQLAQLPHFNPDLEHADEGLDAVLDFRSRLQRADGIVIVSPEYAHSMPGVVKNALDWVVGSGELAGKPVALITASSVHTGGARAQIALTTTLLAQAALVVASLTVAGVHAKLNENGELADDRTRQRLREVLVALAACEL